MPVKVIAVGKLKEAGYQLAAAEYSMRLSRYCKLELVEVPDERDPKASSPPLLARAMDAEAERILTRIKPGDIVVALVIEAEQMDSETFSRKVAGWHARSADVVFVIGGSLGLGGALIARADERLSLSSMTFPHQLARVMLLEQLYRSYKIISGERYHK
jgi:23S rRNA (pseudouridine1915-N3)-methyltransferase